MLSISTPQLSTLGDGVRSRATERMVAHIERHFPRPAHLAGDAAVRKLINRCFADALALDLVGERDLLFLLSLQLYFGAGFREDRQCALFAAILQRGDVATPTARIGRCWREGMACYDRISGAGAGHLDAAISRLAGRRIAGLLADDSPLNSAQAQTLLADIWPEKYTLLQLQDPEAFAGLMGQVGSLAKRHAISDRGAARTLLLLSFVFGTGFADDPMLAPLGRLLIGTNGVDAAAVPVADAFLVSITESGS